VQARTCASNMIVVVAWIVQAHGHAAWNPLGATARVPGSWTEQSGLRGYPSLQAGLRGTVLTLWEGLARKNYGPIIRDLQHCASASTTSQAVRAAGWRRGGAGGVCVVGLVQRVASA